MKKKPNKNNKKPDNQPEPVGGYFDKMSGLTEQEITEAENNLKLLKGRIGEHLKCFITIGYNFDGLPALIIDGKTQQDMDALNMAFHKFIMGKL